MIKQKFIERDEKVVDEGTMGFNDYVTKLENLDGFIERVSEEANNLDGKVLNIQYLENTSNSYDSDAKSPSYISGAVVVYKVKQK